MHTIKYTFQPHGDERGQLISLEEYNDIPFRIKRVYFMYDTLPDVVRGIMLTRIWNRFLYAYMGAVRYVLTMDVRRRLSRLKDHMKDCMLPIICGGKCLISLRMPFLWFSRRKCMMSLIIYGIMMSF